MKDFAKQMEQPEAGKWLNVEEEALYVPDKHFTIYRTSQTCSCCGMRTQFVGQKPFINERYCPACGKLMQSTWIFNHDPVLKDVHLVGYSHNGEFQSASDLPISTTTFEPKNINDLPEKKGN
jgi:hypothetical protein